MTLRLTESLLNQGKAAFMDSSQVFWEWVSDLPLDLTSTEWQMILLYLVEGEDLVLSGIPPESFLKASQRVIFALLQGEKIQIAYALIQNLLFDSIDSDRLSRPNLVDTLRFDLNQQTLCNFLTESAKSFDQALQPSLSIPIREIIFELDPNNVNNILTLMLVYGKAEQEFSLSIYLQAALEALAHQPSPFPFLDNLVAQQALSFLLNHGYDEAFFELGMGIVQAVSPHERGSLSAILSQIAAFYLPEKSLQYHLMWNFEDLLSGQTKTLAEQLLYRSANRGYSILGESLEKIAYLFERGCISQIRALMEAANYYSQAAQSEKVKSIVSLIIEIYPIQELAQTTINQSNWNEVYLLSCMLIVSSAFWSYIMDDQAMLRSFLQVGGQKFSECLYYRAKNENLDWKTNSEPKPIDKTSLSKPLKIGYLSSTFHRHSVGFLSYQTIANHRSESVEIYCYYYHPIRDPKALETDLVYQTLNRSTHQFHHLTGETSDMVKRIRSDQLDILVYLDSVTSQQGCNLVAMRLAPIQISWLGGDSPGLPEIDYCFADPYVLREGSQQDFREKIIRLSTYACVDSLVVTASSRQEIRQALGANDKTILLLTAANARKRTVECIDAQLEILKQVPHSLLVIKGTGEIASVMDLYLSQAKTKGIENRVRFLQTTIHAEEHRGQLPAFDLILDTFPYTGATHTLEALYMGIPILTKVGQHYYGRMSYSLLKNIGLDECITWSIEEYIQRGIQIAEQPNLLKQIKQKIQDSYRSSVVWNSREFSRLLESVYKAIAKREPIQEEQFCKEYLLDYSAQHWNQLALDNVRKIDNAWTGSLRLRYWELALVNWRRSLRKDPYYFCAWMNQIHGLLVIGQRNQAFNLAGQLFELLIHKPEELRGSVEELTHQLVWLPTQLVQSLSSAKMTEQLSFMVILSRWLAEHSGVVYRPESLRFWQLLADLQPQDQQARLILALHQCAQGQIEGLFHIQQLLVTHPDLERLCLAKQIILKSFGQLTQVQLPIITYENYRLALEPSLNSIVTRVLLAIGHWFEGEIRFCQEYLQPGMTVIDVGANVGAYTFLAARLVSPLGQVYAIEPTSNCVNCLRQTIQLNQLENCVTVIESAAGQEDGEIFLLAEEASVFNRVVTENEVAEHQRSYKVPLLTLDTLWQQNGRMSVDLLKVDAEGAELAIFKGSRQMLQTCQPIILFENLHAGQSTGGESAEFLAGLGYQFYTYNDYLSKLDLIDPTQSPIKTLNLIAATSKHRKSLEKFM
ncbi:MAG: FkbM family methyltransferase [Cyanobacteriota bacterium]|nr:FkbM family methyltransferase [Cyanobacteriota bacterium]